MRYRRAPDDAAVAAVCLELGLAIVSGHSDFARFSELVWINPTRG